MGIILVLLLAGAIRLGAVLTRPRIEFSGLPPTDDLRVSLATDRIDPNTASRASMVRLGGIGPVRADAIVKYRDIHGPAAFKKPDDLQGVRGIGPGTINRITPDLSLPR